VKKLHIMVLSVGSLIGQNILDLLEDRRDNIILTGIDSACMDARVFRCDKVYKSVTIENDSFEELFLDIVEKEQPDVILPGRDHDVIFLTELADHNEDIKKRVIVGNIEAIHIMNDKALSYAFAEKFNLPFAKSFILNEENRDQAIKWAKECGFPFLGKPNEGFGSLGIRVICDEEQLKNFLSANTEGFMLQEILDGKEDRFKTISSMAEVIKGGIPLFSQIPDDDQYAGQAIIGPDGKIIDILTSRNRMVIGRCEYSERTDDLELIDLTRRYAEAIISIGWRGPFNFQCRKTEAGYIGHEMNARLSGSTSARRLLGFDELQMLILAFFGIDLNNGKTIEVEPGVVCRSLTDYFVAFADREEVMKKGVWHKLK